MAKSNLPERKTESPYFMFSNAEDLQQAAGNIDSYDGILSASASRRSYLDIEPNISVRTDFSKDDYYRFRPLEEPGVNYRQSMSMCMKAYDKVGIIKNVIDLMGDFASQGITLNHENKSVERFYRKWWEKINGVERSERFLNNLYRCGNVIINKRYGKITASMRREMSKAELLDIPSQKVIKRQLPVKYDFLNPLTIEVEGGNAAAFAGQKVYKMKVSPSIKKSLLKNERLLNTLPEYIRKALSEDANSIILDSSSLEVFYYKKDDWSLWANPMINPIIDDIMMLEKMKLADMSALDGAISNIRLWRLGNLEHKILPNRGAIDKLRNILASNVGGGTMDLVWGPEIDFKESNTQIYKFLGTEKYQPVLNSIYAGLGIPPTLTGLAGQSGGYTNNFISLKTLIDRLEYGRALLEQFWKKELEYIQKSMGFSKPATIHFDHMLLSDEIAEKNLLVRLAEEDFISVETLRERLGENNSIEEKRITQEYSKRKRKAMPPKADPYHNGNVDSEYKKIALQKGEISIEDVTDLTPSNPQVVEPPKSNSPNVETKPPVPNPEGGRPKFSRDQEPRKQKVVKPRTTPSAGSTIVWSQEAQKAISDILNPALLSYYNKAGLRALSKSELAELEEIKFKVLCKLTPFEEITTENIVSILEAGPQLTKSQEVTKASVFSDFMNKNNRSPNIDELRNINAISYAFGFFE
jgi:hypothetical protein